MSAVKYRLVRFIESRPRLLTFIYNHIDKADFLFPHEKDYLGIPLVCDKDGGAILDIGANIGLSTIGFRKLGFTKNPVHMFEPNAGLIPRLENLAQRDRNIVIHNVALSNKAATSALFVPYFKDACLHTFSSFDRPLMEQSLRNNFPRDYGRVVIKEFTVTLARYDDLKLPIRPHFIKIDCEGHEGEVLEGMQETLNEFKPRLLIEYNPGNFERVYSILENAYRLAYYNARAHQVLPIEKADAPRVTDHHNPDSARNLFFVPRHG